MDQLSMQALSFSLNEGNGALLGHFDPAGGAPIPDAVTIRQTLTKKGWGDFHLDDKAVEAFVAACRKAEQPVDMVVGARRDGEFALKVDDDLMTAWFTLVPAQGGHPVTPAELGEALREEGIIVGILHDEIKAAFAAGHCEQLAIARGNPAQEGAPTRFESLFDQEKEQDSDEHDLDRIKYADLCHLLLVKPGDHLMRRVPPVQGKSGMNIKGHPVLPQPTPDIPFRNDLKGAARDPGDPNLLVATAGGQPVRLDNGVMVNSVIEVLDVDLSTGSIAFEGTLHVGGDIKAGMKVKVTGDVIVNGTVEAAEITAGGNVAVRAGIVGHVDTRPGAHALPDTTARIICEGSVQALFMEAAHIEAGKSILISRSSRQCELIAGEEIVVGKGSSKTGQIIGGRTQATLRVVTGVLGASSGVKTHVQVGFDPYLEKQIADKDLEFKRKCEEIDRVVKLLAYFKQNPKKGEGGVAEKVEATRRQLMVNIDDLTAELKVLRDKVQLAEQARVEVGGEIHYGTEIRIAQQFWQAPDDMGCATIQMEGSKIAVHR